MRHMLRSARWMPGQMRRPGAVVVVVSVGPVGVAGVVVCKLVVPGIASGIEGFRVRVDALAVVQGLGWDEEHGVFGDEHAFVDIICVNAGQYSCIDKEMWEYKPSRTQWGNGVTALRRIRITWYRTNGGNLHRTPPMPSLTMQLT